MNTKTNALLLLTVAAIAFLAPKPAQAGDKEAALIGGLLGGIIIGSAIADHRADNDCHDTTIIVTDRDRCAPTGYWDYRTVRVWVPGYWEVSHRHGCSVRVYVPGRWEHRRERSWVAYNDRSYHHDRRHHR